MRGVLHMVVASVAVGMLVLIFAFKLTSSAARPTPIFTSTPEQSHLQLILDQSGQVAALDATLFLRDPFLITNPENVINRGVDRNTRIMIFVMNLQLREVDSSSDVHVILVDSHNQTYDLNAEDVRPVSNFDFTQVVFRVPDNAWPGECTIKVRFHNEVTNSAPLRIRPPKPILSIVPTLTTIYLPDNCPVSFTISNVGPQGSTLNYAVTVPNDDLEILTNATGSLPTGASVVFTTRVQPRWVGFPAFTTSQTSLRVETPDAFNYIQFAVGVKLRNISEAGQDLRGIWSGTWSGNSFGRNNPGQASPTSPVSGTWILNLQSVDLSRNTAFGTLTWNGRDAYWTYTILPGGNVSATPHDFIPNRTIRFDNSNTTLTTSGTVNCSEGNRFHLVIDGTAHAPNPSDAFYGPWFNIDLNLTSGTAISRGNGFITHPYNPANFDTALSNGNLSGSKSP